MKATNPKVICLYSDERLLKDLGEVMAFLNRTQINGAITKSKIVKLALAEWLAKQKQIMQIINSKENMSVEEMLKQNGY
jgi:hypothetical protein